MGGCWNLFGFGLVPVGEPGHMPAGRFITSDFGKARFCVFSLPSGSDLSCSVCSLTSLRLVSVLSAIWPSALFFFCDSPPSELKFYTFSSTAPFVKLCLKIVYCLAPSGLAHDSSSLNNLVTMGSLRFRF